jgi:hypothetical protein
MRLLRLCIFSLIASALAMAGDGWERDGAGGASARTLPRVLRDSEPTDTVMVRLPGPPAPAPLVLPAPPQQIEAKVVTPPARLEVPPVTPDDPQSLVPTHTPKPFYPPDFERDSAMYCQKLIGQWSLEDAGMLLGDAQSARPAFDDNQKENGTIYAFADPTGHYRQLELDFDGASGTLRTVFGYPRNLTWQECRRQWQGNVTAAQADRGRKFYSYLNRRLDVLVDPSGKVISLGLY